MTRWSYEVYVRSGRSGVNAIADTPIPGLGANYSDSDNDNDHDVGDHPNTMNQN